MIIIIIFLQNKTRTNRLWTSIWNHVGFNRPERALLARDWHHKIYSFIFAATFWWAWHHRNLMCLNSENWPINRISSNIHNMVETLTFCFTSASNDTLTCRLTKWNNKNYTRINDLNIDGSCLDSSIRDGYTLS